MSYQEFKNNAAYLADHAHRNRDTEPALAQVYAQLAEAEAQNKLAQVEALKTLAAESDFEQTKIEAMRMLREIAFTE